MIWFLEVGNIKAGYEGLRRLGMVYIGIEVASHQNMRDMALD
jgi:hypothetical protein